MALDAGTLVAKLRLESRQFTTAAGKAAKDIHGVETGAQAAGAGLKALGVVAAASFAIISTAITVAVAKQAQFAHGINEIRTLGVDATFRDIADSVNDLTTTFGQDAQNTIKAYYDAISAGVDGARIDDFLRDAATFAQVGATQIGAGVDLLTTTLNAYHLEADRAREVSAQLFSVIRGGKTTADELGSALGRVLPTASAFGLAMEEAFAAVEVGSRTLSTAEAVTGLKALLQSFAKPTEDARRASRLLGIEWDLVSLQSNGLQHSIQQVVDITKELHPGTERYRMVMAELEKQIEKNTSAEGDLTEQGWRLFETLQNLKRGVVDTAGILNLMIGSSEGLGTALALTANDAQDFKDAIASKEIGEAMQAYQEAAEIMQDFSLTAAQLKEELAALIRQVGSDFIPVLQPLVEWLRDSVRGMREWLQEHEGASAIIGSVALFVTGLTSAIVGLATTFGPALLGIGLLKGGAATAGISVGALVVTIAAWAAGLLVAVAALTAIGLAVKETIGLWNDYKKARDSAAEADEKAAKLRAQQVKRFGEEAVKAAEEELKDQGRVATGQAVAGVLKRRFDAGEIEETPEFTAKRQRIDERQAEDQLVSGELDRNRVPAEGDSGVSEAADEDAKALDEHSQALRRGGDMLDEFAEAIITAADKISVLKVGGTQSIALPKEAIEPAVEALERLIKPEFQDDGSLTDRGARFREIQQQIAESGTAEVTRLELAAIRNALKQRPEQEPTEEEKRRQREPDLGSEAGVMQALERETKRLERLEGARNADQLAKPIAESRQRIEDIRAANPQAAAEFDRQQIAEKISELEARDRELTALLSRPGGEQNLLAQEEQQAVRRDLTEARVAQRNLNAREITDTEDALAKLRGELAATERAIAEGDTSKSTLQKRDDLREQIETSGGRISDLKEQEAQAVDPRVALLIQQELDRRDRESIAPQQPAEQRGSRAAAAAADQAINIKLDGASRLVNEGELKALTESIARQVLRELQRQQLNEGQ